MSDERKDCCKDEANLDAKIQVSPDHLEGALKLVIALAQQLVAIQQNSVVIKTCKTCNCRHFEVTAQPGQFHLTGVKVN